MNKSIIKKALVAIIALVVCIVGVNVQAATATIKLQPNSNQVAVGTEFPVKVSVSNIDAGQGISRFEATLDYDDKMLTKVGPTSIEGMNGWQIQYDSSTKKIVAKNESFVKEDSDLIQITFKVKTKEEIAALKGQGNQTGEIKESTVIGLKNINANNALSTFKINDVAQTMMITEKGAPAANTNNNDIIKPTPTPTPKPTPTPAPSVEQPVIEPVDSNNKPEPQENPDAGVEDIPVIILAALFIVALISYFGYKKFAEKA